jgi:hypothetical protein
MAKGLLHPEYFSKRFLPSLPSRITHSKFDPRVLGHLYMFELAFIEYNPTFDLIMPFPCFFDVTSFINDTND